MNTVNYRIQFWGRGLEKWCNVPVLPDDKPFNSLEDADKHVTDVLQRITPEQTLFRILEEKEVKVFSPLETIVRN